MSIAGTVVLLLVVGSAYRAMVANNRLHDAERDFEAARSALVETRTADVVAALDRAEANLRAARRSATSFPLNLTEPVPLLGSPARAVKDVTTAGNELVAAARELNDAVDTFPTSAEVSLEGHDITALGTAARRSTPVVRGATERLRRAQQAIDGAKGAALPFISRPARGMSETLRDAERTLDGARRGLALVETIAAPTSRLRLLVVSQDSMELRPSGGYIGSYGMMEIANGTAVLTDFAATEDLARPDPPLPPPPDMAPGYTRWLIEDAGWWPDFPTSASSIREVYAAQGGGDVDGVLALTEHAMARLVGTLGEITVPGYAEPVREQGFDERVLYEV